MSALLEWDPAQPRAPKGQADGGQWVAKDAKGGAKVELDDRMVIPTSISPNPRAPNGGWWVLKKGAQVTGGSFDRNAMAFVPRRRKNGIPLGRMVIPTSISPNPAAPNGGWWVLRKGAKVTGGGFDRNAFVFVPTDRLIRGGKKRGESSQDSTRLVRRAPIPELIALALALGHHWTPLAAAKDKLVLPRLSRDARIYLIGAYSGPTTPSHGNTTIEDVTHPKYTKEVRGELIKFLDKKVGKSGKLSGRQMAKFFDLLEDGKGADGKHNTSIKTYVDGIKSRGGNLSRGSYEEVMKRGRALAGNSRYRSIVAGAVIGGLLTEMLSQHVKAIEVASKTNHLRDATAALQRGELILAEDILIGDGDSLYWKLMESKETFLAAQQFQISIKGLFADPELRAFVDSLDGSEGGEPE